LEKIAMDKPVIIVTGASRGLGAAVASWLASRHATVIAVARSQPQLSVIARRIEALGGASMTMAADIANPFSGKAIVDAVLDRFGRIDAVVNNAGVLSPIAALAAADLGAWRRNIEVNLLGPVYLIHAALAALRRQRGRIVNISSGAAVHPMETWSAYCAAKAGFNQLTRVLAAEEPDICVVAVRPGVVDTRMQEQIRNEGAGKMPEAKLHRFISLKAQGGLEPPLVPARSIAWLALYAPKTLSGEFVDYTDQRIAPEAKRFFGDILPQA
jgi:NAD(P)-dependent dehydrogenase (short-subunit alcohol dehydrogenase family)